jgi:hypothetical protein
MTATVYVHIGPHKSGTTFIQQVLAHNERVLARQSTLFPGNSYQEQREAVLELMQASRRSHADVSELRHWRRLVAEVKAWRGDKVVLSVENLDNAVELAVRRLVEALAPADVHVVYTARDLTQVIPAMWHTRMRNRYTQPWQRYMKPVRDAADSSGWPRHLRGQDPRLVLPVWEQLVGRDRIHVVTVPPSGSDPALLWQRFCTAVGLRADDFSLDVPRVNKSLGTAETDLLRRLNKKLPDEVSRKTYDRWVQVFLARQVLEPRPGQQKFGLPPDDVLLVRKYAEQIVDFLREGGYEVVGDLQDLVPSEADPYAVAPDTATDAQVLDVAVDALAALLVKVDRNPRMLRPGTPASQSRKDRVLARLRRLPGVGRILARRPRG